MLSSTEYLWEQFWTIQQHIRQQFPPFHNAKREIKVLPEIQSVWNAKNKQKILSNLVLNAAEVFRFQWQRRYVLGISLSVGSQYCEVWESWCFLGTVLESEYTLVQCILASCYKVTLVSRRIKKISLYSSTMKPFILKSRSGVIKFILDDKTVGPQRDHVFGRATVVLLAWRNAELQIQLGNPVLKRQGRTLSAFTKVRCLKGSRGLPELYVY